MQIWTLYFRFCFYATIPLQHSLLLPLISTSCPVLHLCLLDCFLFMSVCEIKSPFELSFLVWGMCHFHNSSSQCSSASFMMDPEWHLANIVIFLKIVLFPLSLFLLGSHKTFISLQTQISLFDFLSGIELFICFLCGKKGWWQHLLMQPVSVQFCMLSYMTFPTVLTHCGRAFVNYWYFLNWYLHFPAQGHL